MVVCADASNEEPIKNVKTKKARKYRKDNRPFVCNGWDKTLFMRYNLKVLVF